MLTVLGIFALIFFGKFIYDTYLTNNTQQIIDDFRKNEPEEAARLAINRGLNLNTDFKYSENEINESYKYLAEMFKCSGDRDELKQEIINSVFKKALENTNPPFNLKDDSIKLIDEALRQKKYNDSIRFRFDPENTPSGLLHKIFREYVESLTNQLMPIYGHYSFAVNKIANEQYDDALLDIQMAMSNQVEKSLTSNAPHLTQNFCYLLFLKSMCYHGLKNYREAESLLDEAELFNMTGGTNLINLDNSFVSLKEKIINDGGESYEKEDYELPF